MSVTGMSVSSTLSVSAWTRITVTVLSIRVLRTCENLKDWTFERASLDAEVLATVALKDLDHIPLAEVPAEGLGAVEHVPHVRHLRRLPAADVLVEGSGALNISSMSVTAPCPSR